MDKQLPPQQINQEIKDVVNQMFGDMFDSKPKPQPQPAEVFRSQPISGFFFPRKDPYDDWELSAEEATRRAEDLMEQHVHKEAEVLSMLMYAAFRGHPRAMYRLGMAFYTGSQEIVDKVLAEHWLRRCAKLGGECSAQAEAFVKEKFKATDPAKASHTADGYIFGKFGCAVNYRMAFPWCKSAAEQGDAIQMNNLGGFLWKGYPDDGIPQNRDQARGWLLRAAATGYLTAIENVKKVLKIDLFPHARELEQVTAASQSMSKPSTATPLQLLEEWRNSPQSDAKDREFLAAVEGAMRRGDRSAYLALGRFYETKGMRGKAALYLELAYRNGYDDEVCDIMLDFDEEGEGNQEFIQELSDAEDDSIDINKRIESLSFYVDVQGYPKACEKLGDLYFEHEWNSLIDENDRLTLTESDGGSSYYYLYGAVCGYYNCMERIGSYLEQGRVFNGAGSPDFAKEEDPEGAAFWYLKCCDHLPKAAERLGDFYREGIYYEKDPAKAIEYYKKAHEQDSSTVATLNLGEMYYYGEGCAKDWRLAKKYLEMVDYQSRAQELLKKIRHEHPFGI